MLYMFYMFIICIYVGINSAIIQLHVRRTESKMDTLMTQKMRQVHLCHTGSEHPSNQLTCKVWDHHIHLNTSTEIDGQGEWGVEMGTTGEAMFSAML